MTSPSGEKLIESSSETRRGSREWELEQLALEARIVDEFGRTKDLGSAELCFGCHSY